VLYSGIHRTFAKQCSVLNTESISLSRKPIVVANSSDFFPIFIRRHWCNRHVVPRCAGLAELSDAGFRPRFMPACPQEKSPCPVTRQPGTCVDAAHTLALGTIIYQRQHLVTMDGGRRTPTKASALWKLERLEQEDVIVMMRGDGV
jgi:hypothetical protein